MRAMRGGAEWVLCVVAAIGLSCGGDDGGNDANTQLTGAVWYSGPVEGAEVVAYQLVEGERTTEVGRAITDDAGAFVLDLGLAYESIELEARGGSYDEATGGRIALNNADVLRGIALDVAPAEQRGDLSITPWSHLVVTLGESRLARGDKETTFNDAMVAARDLLEAHVGFDPTGTPFARLDLDAGSPTEPVLQSLSLAGLGSLGAAVATEGGLTAQDVNTSDVTAVLATDLGSDEALFDGNGDILTLGPACGLPPGCTARGDDCRSTCQVYWNTVRSRLALAIAGFLQDEHNGTGLAREDLQSYLAALTANEEPELFGGPVEPLDDLGPEITWVTPTSGATVADTITVEVTAADPIGVASLVVDVVGPSTTAIEDTIAAAETFTGPLNTKLYAEGELTLRATAVDDEGNATTADLTITLDNVDGGVLSGVVFKGPVDGATVEVYRYPNGVKGALLGSGTTTSDGTFINVAIADGYAGPLLVEAGGGGTYAEESAPATTVTLDTTDKLRTVIASYTDGETLSNGVVTPLTSFAVTYYEYLRTQLAGTFDTVWATAHAAIEAHFAVPDILTLRPQRPAEMTTFSSPAKYGLVLAGLSRTAWDASNQGGGDGGSFGSAMNAVRVWRVLDQDLADGCWNGLAGATPLVFGGTQAVTATTARSELADEIVAYLASAQNATPFSGAGDILPLLESMSQSGPSSGAGTSCASGEMFPTPGRTYDQVDPVVVFEAPTPTASALVRQTISLRATATDDLTSPIASWAAPGGLVDSDGVAANAIVIASYDTTTTADGDVTFTASAADGAGNVGSASRTFTVDNTPPVLTWPVPAEWITDPGPLYWSPDRGPVLTGTASDAHTVTVNVIVSATPYVASVVGTTWSVDLSASALPTSAVTVTVTATDAAGNATTLSKQVVADDTDPVVMVRADATTTVHNEKLDTLTFDPSTHRATHAHTTNADDAVLGTAGSCPNVYKYVYFLDEGSPLYVTETGLSNPLHWAFEGTDVGGVGIDTTAGVYAYRVRKSTDPAGVYLTGWIAPSTATNVTGGKTYEFSLYRKNAAGTTVLGALGTYSGVFEIELRAKDRFNRETIETRCWTHHPLAPAIQLSTAVDATDHTTQGLYALRLLSLQGNDPVAAQAMNTTAEGAGLIELDVFQAAPEPAYLTLALTTPVTAATYSKASQITYSWESTSTSSIPCGTPDEPLTTPECTTLAQSALTDPGTDQTTSSAQATPTYVIRVVDDSGVDLVQCSGCDPGEYELPASTGSLVHYYVVVAVKDLSDELSLGGTLPYSEPTLAYSGGGANTVVISGKKEGFTKRCAQSLRTSGNAPNQFLWCDAVRTYRQYRMLKSASITFPAANFTLTPSTAPTTSTELTTGIISAGLVAKLKPALNWTTTESPIPTPLTSP